ncbi:MAG: RelA/SpoT family protein [Prevotella sp.]|jgi:GTP pyrophosphokinase|nr:RelA/SpoT family protein [Prevotella sp.]
MSKEERNREDELLIETEFNALIQDYLNSNHRRKVELITKAFNLANEAHKGVRRKSGEPYILHPIAVARIVCSEIGLGSTSICCALLHDVVEDTDYTVENIRELFGAKIAQIVDGLTKIPSGMFDKNISAQAENFRKLLLTMSEDIRVILVKIADRLHNMRTLGSMSSAKQHKIAGETMFIYAPLAHRLGLFSIKTELEELSFKYENPEEYDEISRKLKETFGKRDDLYQHFARPVIEKLDQLGIRYEIKNREKSVYSIYNKMKAKSVPFEEVYDIFAVRIIFENDDNADEKKRCWDIYSAITDIYKLRPDRIRDWVSRPKSNGYQALHLTVMGPDGEWIEVQIRSRRMDDIAEKGFAAHWKYKEGKVEEDNELDKWLKTIKEILENPNPNAIDFLDTIKLNLFSQEIFVFTPKGDIKTLAQGATALDFAYDLHSNLGDHAIGAKVNHKLVPLSHVLRSGDQAEIITSSTQIPQPEWLQIITTARAKTKLEYALKRRKKEIIKDGEAILSKILEEASVELTIPIIDRLLDYYNKPKKEDLFFAIGNNDIDLPTKAEKLLNLKKQNSSPNLLMRYMKQAFKVVKKTDKPQPVETLHPEENIPIDTKKTYLLEEESFKKNFIVAPCCNPIPGDRVFGFVNNNNEVEVHSVTCPEGLKLKAGFGNRIITVQWGNYAQYSFLATIVITGIDRIGILNEITQIFINASVNIKSINIDSNDGVFEGKFTIFVHNSNDIQHLCAQILKLNSIQSVNRSLVFK